MSFLKVLRDLLGKRESPALTPDTPGLEIVAEAFDPAEADSSVLARSPGWVPDAEAVLRHHLTLPRERVAEAASILAQDGWDLRERSETDGVVRVEAQRVQVLDALHCAQERSRMAGLAQRLGGDSLGWDARQPGESPTAPA
ncbi:ribonuclease E inhibitor RraB [Amycolatopsis sp. NPDC059021]|uniref:ribonuclease E inhibitor RraB n=1 Tax=Amycolatopsis sp. NPDC059021 TaxID=3346704 RepID=UPI00366B203C